MRIQNGTVIKDIKDPNEVSDYLSAGWVLAEEKVVKNTIIEEIKK